LTQLFERQDAAQMPETYSEIQLKIFRDRYAFDGEQFPHEAWRRVADAVADHPQTDQETWRERFYDLLRGFQYIPGGRIMAAMGTGAGVTAQNCYVLPNPEDSRDGIMNSLREWVEIQSKGGGVGINMSSLRPRGDVVKGVNGTSSGPVNWAQPFAFISKSVIIQGGSRRGAAMIMLDCDHPDVFEFIHAKETPGVLEGCNVSVCISDAFMETVKTDADWDLTFGGKVYRTVKARQIWDEICEAAWRSAEPGIYFMERANKEANSGYFETLISTNPCGEQPLGPYGACLLGSFNLDAFMRESASGEWSFDFDEFRRQIPSAVRFNDNVVDLSHYPIDECRDSQQRIRRMGIGVMGLADCLLKQKIRYGSEESITFTEAVFRTLRDESYRASVELAKERGPFPEFTQEYLQRPFITRLPEDIRQGIAEHGIRNCYLLTQAPTGTTSLLAGVNAVKGDLGRKDALYKAMAFGVSATYGGIAGSMLMIATPRKAWKGSVVATSSIRSGWLRRPGTGSTPSSGQKNRLPTARKCRWSSWCSRPSSSVASYQPLKYRAKGLATKNSQPTSGKLSSAAGRECSTASSARRERGGSVRSASVTGAPSARKTGPTMVSSMCWTMCGANSDRS